MNISDNDRQILRELALKTVEISALPIQNERKQMWTNLNDLKMTKPMISIYQIPWVEMNVNDELTLCCDDPFLREVETKLRQTIYQWNHMPGDMVVEPHYEIEPVLMGDNFGIKSNENTIKDDKFGSIRSHQYVPVIKDMDDVEKIKNPNIVYDEKATIGRTAILNDIFGDCLPVKVRVRFGKFNTAPWDAIVQWVGVTELMTDIILRPEYVHAVIGRMTNAMISRIDQIAELGFLHQNNHQTIGQGGYGFVSDLPGDDYDSNDVKYKNMWGGGMAQIFSDVSPDMHLEFALNYENKCLERFGLIYYGCCEPLHRKVDLIRNTIPKLRKISMSPWVNERIGAEVIGDTLVYSCKPNPSYLAMGDWHPDQVEKNLRGVLDACKANDCAVELILKDISTVKLNPQRLWAWADTVSRLTEEYAT